MDDREAMVWMPRGTPERRRQETLAALDPISERAWAKVRQGGMGAPFAIVATFEPSGVGGKDEPPTFEEMRARGFMGAIFWNAWSPENALYFDLGEPEGPKPGEALFVHEVVEKVWEGASGAVLAVGYRGEWGRRGALLAPEVYGLRAGGDAAGALRATRRFLDGGMQDTESAASLWGDGPGTPSERSHQLVAAARSLKMLAARETADLDALPAGYSGLSEAGLARVLYAEELFVIGTLRLVRAAAEKSNREEAWVWSEWLRPGREHALGADVGREAVGGQAKERVRLAVMRHRPVGPREVIGTSAEGWAAFCREARGVLAEPAVLRCGRL